MSDVRKSVPAKVIASLLILVSVFSLCWQGMAVLRGIDYVLTDSWQDTWEFKELIREREDQLAEWFAARAALEDPGLAYLDQVRYETDAERIGAAMAQDQTSFRYRVLSQDGTKVLATNLAPGESLEQLVPEIHSAVFRPGEHLTQPWNSSPDAGDPALVTEGSEESGDAYYIIECGVPQELPGTEDEFSELHARDTGGRKEIPLRIAATCVCLVLSLACFAFLMWSSGHKEGVEGIVLTWQEKIYFDLYLIGAGVLFFILIFPLMEFLYGWGYASQESYENQVSATVVSLCVTAMTALAVLVLRTLVVRCKAGVLARTTLVCRACSWIWSGLLDAIRSFPMIWRSVAGFLAYLVLCFFARRIWWDNPIPLFLINLGMLLWLCHWSVCFQRLRKGSEAIAGGNLNHQIDTTRMPHDLRLHAEALNNIADGLNGAVEEKMKSERFKAELITDVSHDLKTPLTSIINYVNLLKMEEVENPKAREYIEVLDRKSQRLKKLTEDLVEASKASTGALTVNREKIGMCQLVDQALGEYEEKLEARKLTVVPSLPEGETYVYADGRHLWRVIDNLLGNCAKYAMEGTRIYLELVRGKGQVTLSIKNISRDPLNVPPERLMERFVRGDESRTTEGSGLGLSIARSLTELQGGTFELAVDGDLFKATVTMPQSG